MGLDYIGTTAKLFFAVCKVLGNMVAAQPSEIWLLHKYGLKYEAYCILLRYYLRSAQNPRRLFRDHHLPLLSARRYGFHLAALSLVIMRNHARRQGCVWYSES